MEKSGLNNNPFAALFGSIEQAQQFSQNFREQKVPSILSSEEIQCSNSAAATQNEAEKITEINSLIEHVFLITLDQEPYTERPRYCVYLEELKDALKGQHWLDLDNIEQAVFERIMLPDPASLVIVTDNTASDPKALSEASDFNPVNYLYHCYIRLQSYQHKETLQDVVTKCRSVILMNSKTCFQHPEFFASLDPASQFMDIFLRDLNSMDGTVMQEFFEHVSLEIDSNSSDGTVDSIFAPVLDQAKNELQKDLSLGSPLLYDYLDLLSFFSRTSCLAQALIRHSTPRMISNGHSFEDTIFGAVLSLSSIAKNELGPHKFFDRPSRYTQKEHDATEQMIHRSVVILNDRMHQLFWNLLKTSQESKTSLLQWLGNCLLANKGRAKLWSNQMIPGMYNQMYCSDGFFLNLCTVLLRLCKPFSEPQHPKLLKIQPTYCVATRGDREQVKNRNVHLRDITETGLIPPDEDRENEQPQLDPSYNFLSECFFMCHYCLHLGFHTVHERFMKLNQDLHRIQSIYSDIVGQAGENSDTGVRIKEQMEKAMAVFLCMKAALTEPQLLDLCFDFHVATTTFLVNMAVSSDNLSFHDVKMPLSDDVPQVLTVIPELVAENVIDFMLFVRRFRDSMFEMVTAKKLEHLMTFILVFMGSPNRMRNPHLRARLAEALEAIIPPKNIQGRSLVVNFQREQLFHTHPLSDYLSSTLLHVFVSIEMTGQGVEFEQKFNYRRPMYAILEYLWDIERHRNQIKELARFAEEHMSDVDAPLFLRFINLLINDATFLLDEGLGYMEQIKKKQEEKDRGDWNSLNPRQRQEAEMNFRHLTMLARFHNMMANDTIKTLEMITRQIKSIFYDDILLDRIVAMLNNHLLCLVGPKKKNLKVKDFSKFEFRPDRTVSHISQIFLNLADGSEAFKRAVAYEERSYSDSLFEQAKSVLIKIHQPMEFIEKFEQLGSQIRELAKLKEAEDDLVQEAPEEFIDPILGTFMRKPVRLPSSGKIVDRSTIARHILSDQFDPFNRQPLTMNMVQPVRELEEKIATWLKEWNQKRKNEQH